MKNKVQSIKWLKEDLEICSQKDPTAMKGLELHQLTRLLDTRKMRISKCSNPIYKSIQEWEEIHLIRVVDQVVRRFSWKLEKEDHFKFLLEGNLVGSELAKCSWFLM